jgi:HlyD family secretion protein
MPSNWKKRAGWTVVVLLLAAGVAWLVRPRPILVDLEAVTKGSMEVTVDDDQAKTNVRHVYTVSAPIAGKVLRISHPKGDNGVSIHVGDQVKATETVVALMQPAIPSFLDVRSREELQGTLTASDAAVSLAEAEIKRIQAALDFARSELQRAEALVQTNAVAARTVEHAQLDVRTNEAALASAMAQLEVRRSEHASVAARLIDPAATTTGKSSGTIELRAPVTGVVLKIIQDSEAFVPAGAPLVAIGDPRDLEIVADLLSTDAVQVAVGATARIDGWGGPILQGRVTRVDPAGFLKVSALGIEEQRVHTTIDLVDPPETWSRLGHDYRVIVHVAVWNASDVLMVPVGALFRSGEEWAVFAVRDGRAHTQLIKIGHRNSRTAEVLSGLVAGDRVVLHPSDRIADGTRVGERDGG